MYNSNKDMDKLVAKLISYGVLVTDGGTEWYHKSNKYFKTNKLYTLISKTDNVSYNKDVTNRGLKEVIQATSESDKGNNILNLYSSILDTYELPSEADIIVSSNSELCLRYDGRVGITYNWYHRSRSNLMEIAFERELKEAILVIP